MFCHLIGIQFCALIIYSWFHVTTVKTSKVNDKVNMVNTFNTINSVCENI